MKLTLGICVITALLALPAYGYAESDGKGAYISAHLNVSIPDKTNVTGQSAAGAGATTDRLTLDSAGGSTLAGGYDFGLLRLEGEIGGRQSKVSSVSRSGSGQHDTDGNLNVFSTLANGYLDFHNNSSFTPYLVGGVGFAIIGLENVYGTNTSTGAVSKMYHANDDVVFAYQAGAGLDYTINKHFSVDVGYRYFGTGKGRLDDEYPKATGLKYNSHDIVAGVKYTF
jgi:opacity protein-like surface antigen